MRRLLAVLVVVFPPLVAAGETPFFDLTRYNDFPEFESYIRGVARMNPDIVHMRLIGFSREHRPLLGLKVIRVLAEYQWGIDFPGIFLKFIDKLPVSPTDYRLVVPPTTLSQLFGSMAVIMHVNGRRSMSQSTLSRRRLLMLQENFSSSFPITNITWSPNMLIHNYGIDEKITSYINLLDIYVFPVLNPDGFIFSRTSRKSMIRQWRKNRAPTNCSGYTALAKNICCEGVDLNRNYDLGFSQKNYPFNNPCSDEFQGPFPFSEPESRAVRDFVLSHEIYGRLHALVSMHTHGQLWILPYNHHKRTYPEDFRELESLATRAADKVYSYRETKYRIGTAADMLGTATGGATDWIKKNTPTKYVYVLELPPDMSTWFAFQIKPHWLIPIGKETWMGIKVILDQVIEETINEPRRRVAAAAATTFRVSN
ncbi:hypothetical protein Y032_0154g2972 [Ancylostoma ceylanicum]|uniref:Peptidase M14 domain-containing protein n=1 Tax=Ancylostoma ceylanicum TaxID=53326 RepID=A0A016T071_9BILA|nr:hypothetical protein Y032_0154g2972 [Ancylostoma ceylanicum]